LAGWVVGWFEICTNILLAITWKLSHPAKKPTDLRKLQHCSLRDVLNLWILNLLRSLLLASHNFCSTLEVRDDRKQLAKSLVCVFWKASELIRVFEVNGGGICYALLA
jgi:hypothetical protein